MTKPFRCHDTDACHAGQSPCPTPWACGVEAPNKFGFFRQIFDAFIAPTCCEVNSVDCNQGRDCPVRSGEYKPKEAIHQIQEPCEKK